MNITEVFDIAKSNSFENPLTKMELDEVIYTIQADAWEAQGGYPVWAEQEIFTNGQQYSLVSIVIDGEDASHVDGMMLLVSDN